MGEEAGQDHRPTHGVVVVKTDYFFHVFSIKIFLIRCLDENENMFNSPCLLFSFISTDIIIWAKISADIKYCMCDSRAVTCDHQNQ